MKVKTLIRINGVTRILTSGGKPTALEGKETIKLMMTVAKDKITILVAGKVTNKNIEMVAKETGAKEFHGRKIVGEINS